MNKRTLDIAYFLSFCIEQYKEAKHLSGQEVANTFSQFGVLNYLEANFEAYTLRAVSGFWKTLRSLSI